MKARNINKGDKVYIIGNGNQAPYGIGEIMEIIPAAHIRKVGTAIGRYYNEPTMRLNGEQGDKIGLEHDADNNLIGYRTLDPY